MLAELKGRGVDLLRCHVLPSFEQNQLLLAGHVTSFTNQQVFEAIIEKRVPLGRSDEKGRADFARKEAEQMRAALVEKLKGFDVKYGVFQE